MNPSEPRDDDAPSGKDDSQSPQTSRSSDEIDLYDLWHALIRRWHIIIGVIALTGTLGFIYAINQEVTFQYRTSLNLGQVGVGDEEQQLVESPSQARSRLIQAIIPSIRAELSERMESVPEVTIQGGEGSEGGEENSLIVMSSEATAEDGETVKKLHKQIISKLQQAHSDIIKNRETDLSTRSENLQDELDYLKEESVIATRRHTHENAIAQAENRIEGLKEKTERQRKSITSQIDNKKRRLEQLETEKQLAKAELERIDEREETFSERIDSTQSLLDQLQTDRRMLSQEASNDPVIGLFLSRTEVGQLRDKLYSLEDKLAFELPNRRETLNSRIEAKNRERAQVREEIENLQLEHSTLETELNRDTEKQRRSIANNETQLSKLNADLKQERQDTRRSIRLVESNIDMISPTAADFVSLRGLKPVGPGTGLIVILSLMLGGMLGVFLALFLQFVEGARQ